ncbi:hypothetical protein OsJ_26016 [Oryza sativa Japonica Group]|uniref:Fungal lipase-type domain-containing protein n=1 Tax=Oryza sativa subsp. japonica TaxID=39947 RepID=A3BPK3_ORYSJ|nr:hypothetical protein OsJ_26016 [Oryza sativa Japonica Group]
MSAAAAAPPATSLLRPAAASLTTASNSSNRVHLKNLEHLFRNRGAAVAVESATPAQQQQPVLKAPLLRLPSFLARGRGEVAMKEEAHGVSPRRLERVLLPAAPDGPSPRGNIAATWRRLHGEHDWRGLLDPLHPDLRREIVRYGEFVGAAYGAFLSRPDAAPGDRARAAPPLQDGGAYRVTAPLFATSSVGLPAWLASAAPCAAQRTSLVGYVAVCDSPAEVRRMGRRDIVIALRGTCTVLEWAENVRAGLVPATDAASAADSPDAPTPKVECGFWNLYKTAAAGGSPSLSEMVVSEVRRLLTKYEGEEARGARVLRVVNAHDVVPRFPPPSRYADVGRELRLDSRASPYLRPDADAACCHDLEAYIHLVDGFLGSHCPFRDNAKRSILRLLENQGGNVKQLYISKAMDMRVRLDAAVADMPAEVLECVH